MAEAGGTSRIRSGAVRPAFALGALIALAPLLAGCELQEVTVVEVADVVVVEAYALVRLPAPGTGSFDPGGLWAFVSRTVGATDDLSVPGARVEVERDDGTVFALAEAPLENCVREAAAPRPGTCYDAGDAASMLGPGDALSLRVELPDGRVLEGETQLPGRFTVEGDPLACRVPGDTPYEIRWSRSEGAQAYVNETRIQNLDIALAEEGIEAPANLYLLGLSISDADTTIVFPGEFGVFQRFDLDQALAVRLQSGLPSGAQAHVGISAADRNYVNWARGGNFNPSGQVRVPSVRGDGTGVFGSIVTRRFQVFAGDIDPTAPPCPGS